MHVLVTAVDVDLVVVHESSAEQFVLPVGTVGEQALVLQLLTLAIAVDLRPHVIELGELGQVHHIETFGHRLPSHVALVGEFGLALLSALGGDEHHTVGGTRAVDGGGGGILEHLDAGDVAGVDGGHHAGIVGCLSRHGYTIDHIERLIAVQRVDTTYLHGDATTRRTGVLCHGHTGDTSLHGLFDRGVHTLLDGFLVDAGHRTGQIGPFHRTITHDDHLVEHVLVGPKCDVQLSGLTHGHTLCGVADVREAQFLARLHRDLVFTVDVGDGCRTLVTGLYGSSDNLFARLSVSNDTIDFDILRIDDDGRSQSD